MTDTLIAKLEKLTGPSREVDADIFIAITPGVRKAGRIDRDGGVVGWWPRDTAYQGAREVSRFTASIDAKLPGEDIVYMRRITDAAGSWYEVQQAGSYTYTGRHAIEAVARRIARLKACAQGEAA